MTSPLRAPAGLAEMHSCRKAGAKTDQGAAAHPVSGVPSGVPAVLGRSSLRSSSSSTDSSSTASSLSSGTTRDPPEAAALLAAAVATDESVLAPSNAAGGAEAGAVGALSSGGGPGTAGTGIRSAKAAAVTGQQSSTHAKVRGGEAWSDGRPAACSGESCAGANSGFPPSGDRGFSPVSCRQPESLAGQPECPPAVEEPWSVGAAHSPCSSASGCCDGQTGKGAGANRFCSPSAASGERLRNALPECAASAAPDAAGGAAASADSPVARRKEGGRSGGTEAVLSLRCNSDAGMGLLRASAELLRCDLTWVATGCCEGPMTPVQGCELHPVVIVRDRYGAFFDDDEVAEANPVGKSATIFFRWMRGPPRAVCALHPHRPAQLQCTVTLRCFCGYPCFQEGQRQLRRFYRGVATILPHPNPYTYGVPCAPFVWRDFDANLECDTKHLALLIQAGLVTPPGASEEWQVVATERNYTPSKADVGRQLQLETLLVDNEVLRKIPRAIPRKVQDADGSLLADGSGSGAPPEEPSARWPEGPDDDRVASGVWASVWECAPRDAATYRCVRTACCVPSVELAATRRRRAVPRPPLPPSSQPTLCASLPAVAALGNFGGDARRRVAPPLPVAQAASAPPARGAASGAEATAGGSARLMTLSEAVQAVVDSGGMPLSVGQRPEARTLFGEGGISARFFGEQTPQGTGRLAESTVGGSAATSQQRMLRNVPATPLPGPDPPSVSVMTWNVLAELYGTLAAFPHCEPYMLAWAYRRTRILDEIVKNKPDIVCLQEVQSEHYEDFFAPSLAEHGYAGVYKQKTREIFTGGSGKKRGGKFTMDGCATFFLKDKFRVIDQCGLEFVELIKATSRAQLPRERLEGALKRLLKDNVALLVLLELQPEAMQLSPPAQLSEGKSAFSTGCRNSKVNCNPSPGPQERSHLQRPRLLLVANTHIVANPDSNDVKIWQAQSLLRVLEHYLSSFERGHVAGRPGPPALILCGDFNSTPDSAVYELILTGRCDRQHVDLVSDRHGLLEELRLGHSLKVKSAYALSQALWQGLDPQDLHISRACEPAFTNFTHNYTGCLDYIFFSDQQLRITEVVEVVDHRQLAQEAQALQLMQPCLPSPLRPSDHIPLVCDLEWLD